jgi:hypothetical protein
MENGVSAAAVQPEECDERERREARLEQGLSLVTGLLQKAPGGLTRKELLAETGFDKKVLSDVLKSDVFVCRAQEGGAIYVIREETREERIDHIADGDIQTLSGQRAFRELADRFTRAISNAQLVPVSDLYSAGQRLAYLVYIVQQHESRAWRIGRTGETRVEERAEIMRSRDRCETLEAILKNMLVRKESGTNTFVDIPDNILTYSERQLLNEWGSFFTPMSEDFTLASGRAWSHHYRRLGPAQGRQLQFFADRGAALNHLLNTDAYKRLVDGVIAGGGVALDTELLGKLRNFGLIFTEDLLAPARGVGQEKPDDPKPVIEEEQEVVCGDGKKRTIRAGEYYEKRTLLSPHILLYRADLRARLLRSASLGETLDGLLSSFNFSADGAGELGLHLVADLNRLKPGRPKIDLNLKPFFAVDKNMLNYENFRLAVVAIYPELAQLAGADGVSRPARRSGPARLTIYDIALGLQQAGIPAEDMGMTRKFISGLARSMGMTGHSRAHEYVDRYVRGSEPKPDPSMGRPDVVSAFVAQWRAGKGETL